MYKIKHRISIRIKKPLRKKLISNTNQKSYMCSNCKYIIKIENKFSQDTVFPCPNCGQKNRFKGLLEKPEKKYVKLNKLKSLLSHISINGLIIGLILIIVSIALLFKQNPYTTKLSLTLIIIGVIFPLFITEKKQNISIIITFSNIIYIILLFLITGTDLEIFLILIFLGILITKTVINEYLPESLKIRMNIFLFTFFIIFVIFVTKRIISLVNI